MRLWKQQRCPKCELHFKTTLGMWLLGVGHCPNCNNVTYITAVEVKEMKV